MTDQNDTRKPSDRAVATPYAGEPGFCQTCCGDGCEYCDWTGEKVTVNWEWNVCPDCGKRGAHHQDEHGRGGVRCG